MYKVFEYAPYPLNAACQVFMTHPMGITSWPEKTLNQFETAAQSSPPPPLFAFFTPRSTSHKRVELSREP